MSSENSWAPWSFPEKYVIDPQFLDRARELENISTERNLRGHLIPPLYPPMRGFSLGEDKI